jgi:3',5'-cyclic AMP phosphodiesterase CpdA
MRADKPDFAASVGDAWYGYGGSFDHFRSEIDAFMAQVDKWDVPLYSAFGNHEVTGSAEREEYLKKRFGNLFGSFDFGDAHFIFLDSDEVGKEGVISGKQLSWLECDLETNGGASAVFVFLHRPLFSVEDPELKRGRSFRNRENRDALHRLFVTYRVKAVFAGHEHLFDERTVDGIRYYITGGGGAPMGAIPDKGGFFHYLLVTVSGKKVAVEVKRLQERP